MINGMKIIEAMNDIVIEKNVDKKFVIEGIKEGFKKTYEKFFDLEANIRVDINEQTGLIEVYKELTVVKKIEDEWLEIGLNQAKEKFGEDLTIGDKVYEPLKFTEDYTRTAVNQVGQIIKQKIREAEKQKIYDEFLPRLHTIILAEVIDKDENSYLLEYDNAYINLWIKKVIPGEKFNIGDKVKVFIEEVSRDNKYSQVFASRVDTRFLERLFEEQIPEIKDGIVEVKNVSREPGKRAKVAVWSNDEFIDPIGSCIGAHGSRIKQVSGELCNEKIDLIKWNSDKKTFLMNALAPVRVINLDVNEEETEANIVVPNEQLSLSIGRQGMAAKLVASLVNMKINITSFSKVDPDEIEWNGNITLVELSDPEFVNNMQLRKQNSTTKNSYLKQDNENQWDQPIAHSFKKEVDSVEYNEPLNLISETEIKEKLDEFNSIHNNEYEETSTVELENIDDYDDYYEK